ncbi:MAG TPA: cyclodeaminase/cyclohydrolase family protein [Bacillota bacterium]|nr:cyclodeaminase/cyclohydrolase family protein [Bacillota bacterium]
MAMAEKSCAYFLDVLASKAPVPGGGGAAAMGGAIGMALSNMVGNLTVGKKKFADVEDEVKALLEQGYRIIEDLKALVDKDAEVFEPLSRAYGLPKDTPEQAEHKARVLEECSITACSVPLEIMRKAYAGIKIHERMAQIGTKLAISDVGCGVAFLKAALISGQLNVLINLGAIKNEKFVRETTEEMNRLLEDGCRIADETLQRVIEKLS